MDFSEVLKRRTIRQFTQEPLKKEDLCAILNAARLASCASNKQRLRYLVATESSLVAKILPHTAYAALVQPHRDPVPGRTSPTVFIAVVCNCEPGPLLHADAGAAIQSMEFAAWERGIGCCWVGSHKRARTGASRPDSVSGCTRLSGGIACLRRCRRQGCHELLS